MFVGLNEGFKPPVPSPVIRQVADNSMLSYPVILLHSEQGVSLNLSKLKFFRPLFTKQKVGRRNRRNAFKLTNLLKKRIFYSSESKTQTEGKRLHVLQWIHHIRRIYWNVVIFTGIQEPVRYLTFERFVEVIF